MQHTAKEKVSTDRNIVHLLTMNIKDSFLGSIQNIFLYKRINNKMKVMRTVLLKRVPLSVKHNDFSTA